MLVPKSVLRMASVRSVAALMFSPDLICTLYIHVYDGKSVWYLRYV